MYFSFFFWGMGDTGNFDRHCAFGVIFDLEISGRSLRGVICRSSFSGDYIS